MKDTAENSTQIEVAAYLTSFEDDEKMEQVEDFGLWLMDSANDSAVSCAC